MLRTMTIALSLAAVAAPAYAQGVCSNGIVTEYRLDKLTGSRDDFNKAVADHQAWYKSHGSRDVIVAADVLTFDEASHTPSVAKDEVATFHYHVPGGSPTGGHDAAWDAFVAEYKASSTIESEKILCIPNAR